MEMPGIVFNLEKSLKMAVKLKRLKSFSNQ